MAFGSRYMMLLAGTCKLSNPLDMSAWKVVFQLEANASSGNVSNELSMVMCEGAWSHRVFHLDAYEDRQTMSMDILPSIQSITPSPKRLLWVGVQPYTLRYEYLLGAYGIEMSSLEMSPQQSAYGSSQNHYTGPVQDAAKHFQASSFDVVRELMLSCFHPMDFHLSLHMHMAGLTGRTQSIP